MRILVIAAHPDDEVLGCGATIARLSTEGNDVSIAILGEGITSRYMKREEADKKLIHELKEKARKVGEFLGAKDVFLFDLPDNRFDTIALLDIVKLAEDIIRNVNPVVIFTHHSGDLNIDHNITHRAVLTATRPQKGCNIKELHTFEVPSSTEWAFDEFKIFKPNLFFDITKTIETKIKAIEMYDSEVMKFPHPRSTENLRVISKKWGGIIGCEYAEAFETIRRII